MFEEHENRVYRIAYGFVDNEEDAKDIVQEVFLKVYRYIQKFRGLSREETIALLVICTRNQAIDFLRMQNRRLNPSSLTYEDDKDEIKEYEIPDPSLTPEEILVQNELAQRLGKYIDSLPAGQREALLLRYKFDMKEKDIARILKIDVSAVSSRLNRARNSLREKLAAEEE